MGKVHTSGDCVRGPPFLAHLLFGGWGGTECWRFFCACGGPPNFSGPGPSNGVKRVGGDKGEVGAHSDSLGCQAGLHFWQVSLIPAVVFDQYLISILTEFYQNLTSI